MNEIELKEYLQNSKRLSRLSDTAKYMYKHEQFPIGKEEEMLDVIAKLDAMSEKWF